MMAWGLGLGAWVSLSLALTISLSAGGGNPFLGLPGQDQKSVKAGVYTAAQSDRGQVLFRSKFYTSFAGKPMWEMFDVISDTMPEDNPGSMKPEEYVDVMAYLLKLNNFPTGNTELPVGKEALSAIVMEKP